MGQRRASSNLNSVPERQGPYQIEAGAARATPGRGASPDPRGALPWSSPQVAGGVRLPGVAPRAQL